MDAIVLGNLKIQFYLFIDYFKKSLMKVIKYEGALEINKYKSSLSIFTKKMIF